MTEHASDVVRVLGERILAALATRTQCVAHGAASVVHVREAADTPLRLAVACAGCTARVWGDRGERSLCTFLERPLPADGLSWCVFEGRGTLDVGVVVFDATAPGGDA